MQLQPNYRIFDGNLNCVFLNSFTVFNTIMDECETAPVISFRRFANSWRDHACIIA